MLAFFVACARHRPARDRRQSLRTSKWPIACTLLPWKTRARSFRRDRSSRQLQPAVPVRKDKEKRSRFAGEISLLRALKNLHDLDSVAIRIFQLNQEKVVCCIKNDFGLGNRIGQLSDKFTQVPDQKTNLGGPFNFPVRPLAGNLKLEQLDKDSRLVEIDDLVSAALTYLCSER